MNLQIQGNSHGKTCQKVYVNISPCFKYRNNPLTLLCSSSRPKSSTGKAAIDDSSSPILPNYFSKWAESDIANERWNVGLIKNTLIHKQVTFYFILLLSSSLCLQLYLFDVSSKPYEPHLICNTFNV